jgi:hypothetical protein
MTTQDEDYRKPQGRAPEPELGPAPTPEEVFRAAVFRELTTPILHEGVLYQLTHLGLTGTSEEEDEVKYPTVCSHLFEVHAIRQASWWRSSAELYRELVHGSSRDWRTADGKKARTPDDVFTIMLERRKLLRAFEIRRGKNP